MYSRKLIGYDLSDSLELKDAWERLNLRLFIKLKVLKGLSYSIRIEETVIAAMYTHKILKRNKDRY